MRNAPSSPTGQRLLSRTAEHALRAALYLGRRGDVGFVPASEVAEALGMPPNYTSKTLRRLARNGLVRSLRGPQGGFALCTEPSEVSVARLVAAVDERVETTSVCLLGDRPCDDANPCAAHRTWIELLERADQALQQTTLADLLGHDVGAFRPAPESRLTRTPLEKR